LKAANVTVISMNGMLPFYKNKEDFEEIPKMLDWLNSTLANSNSSFMLMSHVYPANNYYGSLEVFWNTTYTEALQNIIFPYQDRFIFSLGAHVHRALVMAPESIV